MAKRVSAAFGEIVGVLIRAPQYRDAFLSDREWLVLTALATDQFALAEGRHKESGADRPGAANEALKKLRILVRFAIDNGWRHDDPCARIKKFAEGEFHTWTDDEIAAFERRWSLGTLARTAFALLLYTGQRRSDVVGMAWPEVDGGVIHVVQGKTGAKLGVPIHSALAAALAQWPRGDKTILVTSFGKAFTGNGFGNFMADRIAEAGLPERCVTHGLRKAAARRLAEAGCSANEIAAITGHATLAEVSRYTKAADQKNSRRPQLLV